MFSWFIFANRQLAKRDGFINVSKEQGVEFYEEYILQADFIWRLFTRCHTTIYTEESLRGFSLFPNNIINTAKTHEQRAICLCVFYYLKFLTGNATNPLFTSGLRVKGGKRANSLPFNPEERR